MSSEACVNLFLLCYFSVVFAFLEFYVFFSLVSLPVGWRQRLQSLVLATATVPLSSLSLFPLLSITTMPMSAMSFFFATCFYFYGGLRIAALFFILYAIFHYLVQFLSMHGCSCAILSGATKTHNYPPTQSAMCSIFLSLCLSLLC
jgi:hypothetical protein